ncbi:MAG TPA: sulfite exporter TauE/SafE family protein [Xanthobacteraceae bacterium]|nr:sulfite exporter TauE/SafE family protein [Xanthobacteraceae bacterium]
MQLLLDPWFVLTACAAVTLLGLSKGGFIGLGTVGLPLLSLFVPPLQAAAILLPTVLAQDVLTIWTYRRDWSARNLAVLLPSMGVGISVAYFFAAAVSAAEIRLAVGIIIIIFVLRHWLESVVKEMTLRPSIATGILFGIIGGFSTMLANAGGPAWQMHLLPQKLDKLTYVGTITVLFAASNIMKIPAYAALGQLTADNLLLGATLLPLAMAANYTGIWLVRRTPAEVFYRIAYVLMFVIALELIRNALTEMIRAA